ncbi:type II secretion system minor pseudopilin GspJ [Faucicola mancuniensis]|uniref:type II secretion system minor pseudopilin GspJ n=1 Tax=Faucicola mancuniensis TaxID=1309795 RepID=UPI0039779A5B
MTSYFDSCFDKKFSKKVSKNNTFQQGFTLIELLIAMLIFAMLALSGWQIMDALTKSRERAKVQIETLSQLQYAYLQLSQDFAQVTNYVAVPVGLSNDPNNQNNQNLNPQAITASFTLTPEQVSFIRFASPDPRFNPMPTLAKIGYFVQDNKLVKQRSYQLSVNDKNQQTQINSVILNDVKDVKWSAWSATPQPELVNQFPDSKTLEFVKQNSVNIHNQQVSNQNNANGSQNNSQTNLQNASQNTAQNLDLTDYQQLPKGVVLSFTYQDQPIVWQFALADKAPKAVVALNQTQSNHSQDNSQNSQNNQQNSSQNNTQNSDNTSNADNTNTSNEPNNGGNN